MKTQNSPPDHTSEFGWALVCLLSIPLPALLLAFLLRGSHF